MSMPNGPGGINPAAEFGVSETGISGLPNRTQPNIVALLKQTKFPASSPWKNPAGMLAAGWNGILSSISGAATNAVNALTQIGTLIWKTGGNFIDDVGDFINAALSNANTALSNAGISLAGLQDFLDAIGSAFGGSPAGNTSASVNAKAVEIAEAALNAEAAAIALQAQQASGGTGAGLIAFVDTLGDDGDPLSATDWGPSGPSAGDIVVRGTSVPCVGIADAEPVGLYWVPSTHVFTSSDQRFEAVVGQGGGHGSASYLLFHCNAAVTEGGYLKYSTTGLDCGKFTRSGSTFTFTPFPGGAWSQKIGSGTRVEIQNDDHTYDLSINGTIVKTVVDGAASVTMDASHVTAALALERKLVTYNPGLPWETEGRADSLRPSAVLISDYVPIVYQGSGAFMYRTSTTAVGASSGVNAMPASFFGVIGAETDDITCDLATGKFTVSVSDWYHVEFRVDLDQDTTGASPATTIGALSPYPLEMVVYRNGAVARYVGPGFRATPFNINTTSGGVANGLQLRAPDAAQGSTVMYLSAGDYVQLGYDASGSNSSVFRGEATGTKTYFEIARMRGEA